MFGVARWTYNKAVEVLQDPQARAERQRAINPKTEKPISWKQFLRNKLVKSDGDAVKANPWLLDLAFDIRDDSVKDVTTAMKGCWTKLANGTLDKFTLKFRSRKRNKSESMYFRSRWIEVKQNSVVLHWPNQPEMEVFTGKNKWEGKIVMDCRLQRTWNNDYYLCIPTTTYTPRACEADSQGLEAPLKVCSLDPGVRTFQTVFDASRSRALQVAPRDMQRVFLSPLQRRRRFDVEDRQGIKVEASLFASSSIATLASPDS